MHHYAPFYYKFSQQFKLPKHQRAQLSNLVLKKFLAVPTFETLFHVAADRTIKWPRFPNFLSSSKFRKQRINSVIMHQLASLISKVSLQSQLPKHRFK